MKFDDIEPEFLNLVKKSLRIDGSDDDDLLSKIIVTARKNIAGQIGDDVSFYDDNDEFDYAVVLMSGHLYTNRSATSTKQMYEVPIALQNLVLSLKEQYLLLGTGSDGDG